MRAYRTTVHMLFALTDEQAADPESSIADGMNGILTEQMRKYAGEQSPLLDWVFSGGSVDVVAVPEIGENYEPDDDGFPFPTREERTRAAIAYLANIGYSVSPPKVTEGSRVRLVQPVDIFPTGFYEAGLTGTLIRIDAEGSYWVKLDKHCPELAEWDNQVQIWDWSKDSGPDEHPSTYLEELRPSWNAWSAHPTFGLADWQAEIAAGDTRRGYADWVEAQIEQEADAREEQAKAALGNRDLRGTPDFRGIKP